MKLRFHCYDKILLFKHISLLEFWTTRSQNTAVLEHMPKDGTVNQECLHSWFFFKLQMPTRPSTSVILNNREKFFDLTQGKKCYQDNV